MQGKRSENSRKNDEKFKGTGMKIQRKEGSTKNN